MESKGTKEDEGIAMQDVPEGYLVATENTTSILIPLADQQSVAKGEGSSSRVHDSNNNTGNAAFLNPIQEFNRDLSICAIASFCKLTDEDHHARQLKKSEHQESLASKKRRGNGRSDTFRGFRF